MDLGYLGLELRLRQGTSSPSIVFDIGSLCSYPTSTSGTTAGVLYHMFRLEMVHHQPVGGDGDGLNHQ